MPRLRGRAKDLLFLTPPASWRAVPAQESQLCFRTQVLPEASGPSQVAFTVPGSGAVCLVRWLLSALGDTLHLLSPQEVESPGVESTGAHWGWGPGRWVHALGSAGWAFGTPRHCPEQPPPGMPHHPGTFHRPRWFSITQALGHHPSPGAPPPPGRPPWFGEAPWSSNVTNCGFVCVKSASAAPRRVPAR